MFLPDEITEEDHLVVIRDGKRWVRTGLISVVPKEDRWIEPNDKNPSRHYTYNFNVFVMMQVFNFVNARKINDEYNIFTRITSSLFFPVIVVIIFILQIIILTFGSIAFRCRMWVRLFCNLRVLESLAGLSVLPSLPSDGSGALCSRLLMKKRSSALV
jgi:hypothetical protein